MAAEGQDPAVVAVEDDLERRLRSLSDQRDESLVGRDLEKPCRDAAERSLPRWGGRSDGSCAHVLTIIGDVWLSQNTFNR